MVFWLRARLRDSFIVLSSDRGQHHHIVHIEIHTNNQHINKQNGRQILFCIFTHSITATLFDQLGRKASLSLGTRPWSHQQRVSRFLHRSERGNIAKVLWAFCPLLSLSSKLLLSSLTYLNIYRPSGNCPDDVHQYKLSAITLAGTWTY